MRILLPIILFCFNGMFFTASAQQQATTEVKMPKEMPECPARYINGAILASDGSIWVVSEKEGVYKLGPEGSYGGPWLHADYYANYPDTKNFYCIAEDKQGRLWVGTDNKGVAVFNGINWKEYGRENAVLGERVFDIAVSPLTGEVAIATSAGVTIYNPAGETWKDLTRAEGLAEDQVESLDFSPDGSLWLAYACGGVSKGSPKDGYSAWETTRAPWYWDKQQCVRQPYEGRGSGLPSNLCNTIKVGETGTVWVGTISGLGIFQESKGWRFVRGEDYKGKNNGVFGGRPRASGADRPVREDLLLPDDFVTCLAECKKGLWVGTRDNGAALVESKRYRVLDKINGTEKKPMEEKWMTAIIPFPDGTVCAGTYGGGFIVLKRGGGKWQLEYEPKTEVVSHPAMPSAPDKETLEKGVNSIANLNPADSASPVFYWKDDWSTNGNWCGRYGANYAILCAANAPWCDEIYRFFDEKYRVSGIMGAHRKAGDTLRHWVHWVNASKNQNVLYCPTDATRCEAEWDDHGEAYSKSHDGPDVWAVVKVPEGRQMVSLYFFNPNGLDSPSGQAHKRDYLIEVRKYQPTIPMSVILKEKTRDKRKIVSFDGTIEDEMGKALSSQVLARARVNRFAGVGVYKNFMVQGPGVYFFRVSRNYSFNTILNGVFVQRIDKNHPDNEFPNMGHVHFFGIYPTKPKMPQNPELESARQLLAHRETCPFNSPAALAEFEKNSLYLYRYARKLDTPQLANVMAWNLNIWSAEDREGFPKTMMASWYNKQERSPAYRSAGFMPNAPNVIPFSHFEVLAMHKLNVNWRQYLPTYQKEPDIPVAELRKVLAAEMGNINRKMIVKKAKNSRKKK